MKKNYHQTFVVVHLMTYIHLKPGENTDQMEVGIQFWASDLGLSPKYG